VDGIFIRCVPKVGFKRLTHEEESKLWRYTMEHCRRVSRRAHVRLAHVEYDNLSPSGKTQYLAGRAMLGAVVMFSKHENQNAIEDEVARKQKAISFDETIAALKK